MIDNRSQLCPPVSGKLLADRSAPPQFVEKVQHQGHNEVSFEGELSSVTLCGSATRSSQPFPAAILTLSPERFYFAARGTTHKYSLRDRKSFFPLVSTVTSLSGGQSPMLNVFDTIRVPGSKSWSSFGRSRKLRLDNRNRVTTVAS